jgi:hypothetical protein
MTSLRGQLVDFAYILPFTQTVKILIQELSREFYEVQKLS